MSRAPQETLVPAPFTVTVDQLETVFHTLKTASDRRITLSNPIWLGYARAHGGLFSELGAGIEDFNRRDETFQATIFMGNYADASSSYWSESKIEELKNLFEQHYPLWVIGLRQTNLKTNVLFIHHVLNESTLFVNLGWHDEKTRWTERVRALAEKVRESEYDRLAHEDELRELTHDKATSIPNRPLVIAFSRLDIVTFRHKPFVLRDEEDFVQKIQEWGRHIERTVNWLARIKGLSQSGNFRIGPPSEFHTLLRIHQKLL